MKTDTFASAKIYLKDLVNQVITVDPKILTIDKNNPNFMSKKKIDQLCKVIDKYGFLYPIIIDMEGNIIDGHQRLQAAIKLKIMPTALVIDTAQKDVDKKFLRQWLNKFRGIHDPEMDVNELDYLFHDEVGSVMMEEYMDIKFGDLDEMRKALENTPIDGMIADPDPVSDKKRRIVLYYTAPDFKTVRKQLDDLMTKYEVMDEGQAIRKLLDEYSPS